MAGHGGWRRSELSVFSYRHESEHSTQFRYFIVLSFCCLRVSAFRFASTGSRRLNATIASRTQAHFIDPA